MLPLPTPLMISVYTTGWDWTYTLHLVCVCLPSLYTLFRCFTLPATGYRRPVSGLPGRSFNFLPQAPFCALALRHAAVDVVCLPR